MKTRYLNLGCGAERWNEPGWTHLDHLYAHFTDPEAPERKQLEGEPRYVDFEVLSGPLPFADNSVEAILGSHFFEHWDAQQALAIMRDCHRILQPGGFLLASVPDASYFRRVYAEDRNENWPRLFDVTDPRNPIPKFTSAALWFPPEHKQLFTEDSLWHHFTEAGFAPDQVWVPGSRDKMNPTLVHVLPKLNRSKFSVVLIGRK